MKHLFIIVTLLVLQLNLLSQQERPSNIDSLNITVVQKDSLIIKNEISTNFGLAFGYTVDHNASHDRDLSGIFKFGKVWTGIGFLMNEGFGTQGLRLTLGNEPWQGMTFGGSLILSKDGNKSNSSFGFEVGMEMIKGFRVIFGIETERGARIGLMYLR